MSDTKKPFDVNKAVPLLREATAGYPRAALFALHAEGHASVFEILVACVLSIRTRDEVTLPTSRELFAAAPTPAALAALSEKEVDALVGRVAFHAAKAKTIRAIAAEAVRRGGELPCDRDVLLSFSGVGPKCANLALGIACGQALIGVDVHVHRVTNRWGIVATKTPEQTMAALQEALPRRHWVEINALLVPFGKHVCTASRPRCSGCVVVGMCRQVGVTTHR